MSLHILPPDGDKLNSADAVHSTRSNQIKAALKYAERGIPVFPCKPDKSPYTQRGFYDATTDRSRVHAYWNRWPGALIGIPTGERSGFSVADVDDLDAYKKLVREHGKPPTTWTVRTPRGGLHLYLKHRDGITNSPGGLPNGIDIRGQGGYVIAPPSPGYEVIDRSQVADAPEWLLEKIRDRNPEAPRRPARSRERVEIPDGQPIPEGSRNGRLFFIALNLKDAGKSREEALDKLLAINEQRCQPQLDADEVGRIVTSAFRYPIRSAPTPKTLEAIEELEKEWWRRHWSGMGGKTDRDTSRVLIELAHRYGMLREDGSVEVSASVRSVALAAATTFETVSRRVTKRLAEAGIIRKVDNGRGRAQAATWVLLPPASPPVNTQHLSSPREEEVLCVDDQLRSRLWDLETPCFRWSGHVKKGRAGVLYVLEAHGSMSLKRLAELMGWGNHRELKRRYLVPLEEQGLIENRGGEYALPDDYGERVEEVRSAPYTTIRRRRRKTQDGDRTISWVQETEHTTSEVESYEAARRKYADQSKNFKLYLKSCSTEADDECRELLNAWDDERDGLVVEFTGCNSEPDQEVVA